MKRLRLTYQIFPALLIVLCLGFSAQIHGQTYEDLDGGLTKKDFGPAMGAVMHFKNETGEPIYDFTLTVEDANGDTIPQNIVSASLSSSSGNDFTQTHNTNKSVRIKAKNSSDRIGKGKKFTLNLTLDAFPIGIFYVIVQPTEEQAKGIAMNDPANPYSPQRNYLTTLAPAAILMGTYTGIAFNDVNNGSAPLLQIALDANGFNLLDAYQKDTAGLIIPGSFFDPVSGMLILAQPVLPGEQFLIGCVPDTYLPGLPMVISALLVGFNPQPEPPGILGVNQLIDSSSPTGTLTNTGELEFYYIPPPPGQDFYLNLWMRPLGSTQTFWIMENMAMEEFNDTVSLSFWFDLDPLGLNNPPLPIPFVEIGWMISDSLHILPLPPGHILFDPIPVLPDGFFFGGAPSISSHILDIPPIPLPPLPPRTWNNGTSRGVLIGCNMPNEDLNSGAYPKNGINKPYVPNDYDGDHNACAPVATANSFSWMRGEHPKIDSILTIHFGVGDSARRKILAEFSELMNRRADGKTGIKNFIKGKLAFIDKYKLPIRVSYQSVLLVQEGDSVVNSPDSKYGHKAKNKSVAPTAALPHRRITREWFFDQMNKGADVELNVQWMKKDPVTGAITYPNGHYVVVTGIKDNNGNYRIKWKDDKKQGEAGGTRQGISNMEVDPTLGILRLPQMDTEAWGEAFIEDVVSECYDPTVTFNAVTGKAFEDTNGSGTKDAGEGGVGGAVVKLHDSAGNQIGTTTTGPDGEYAFPDLAPGDYILEFPEPLGYDFSPKDQGGDDTNDSDVDPLNGLSDLFTLPLGVPMENLDAGMIPIEILEMDLRGILEPIYIPGAGEMTHDLLDGGILPAQEPYTGLGWTITDGIGATRKTSPDTPYTALIVDWMVIEIRDEIDPTLILASQPALLLSNGKIVNVQGKPVRFYGFPHGLYHVALRHRNCLGIMTLNPVPLNSVATLLDFTDSALATWGTHARAIMSDGKMAMIGGDADGSGAINAGDRSDTWNFRNAVGYLPWDINLDGVVNAADRSGTWNRRNTNEQLP